MACGSGCCGQPAAASAPADSVPAVDVSAPLSDIASIHDQIQVKPIDDNVSDSDHVPDTPAPELPTPDCCKDKDASSPCCDDSCLDRLALRECMSTGSSTQGSVGCHLRSKGAGKGAGKTQTPGQPCIEHRQSIRAKYDTRLRLEALSCICRTLVALGQESCCVPRRSGETAQSSSKSKTNSLKSASNPSRSSIDSCCAPRPKPKPKPKPQSCGNSRSCKAPGTDTFCLPRAETCCSSRPAESGCKKTTPTRIEKTAGTGNASTPTNAKHVVLSITGMTCTGCETKLTQTLATFPGISNLKTSLVLARAEFDLADNKGTDANTSVAGVVHYLSRRTEFTFEEITKGKGIGLDIVVPPGLTAKSFVERDWPWPVGVLDVRAVDKTTIHVQYNPTVIGAGDLVAGGYREGDSPLRPLRLAELGADPMLDAGAKSARREGYMTLLSALLTIPVLILEWAPLPGRPIVYGSVSLALATIVQFAVAGPFYPKALKALVFARVIEMDLLIVASTTTAYIFSVVSFAFLVVGQPLSTGQFFATSTLLVTLIVLGRWVAALARHRAVASISIKSLQTPTVTLVVDGQETEMDARLLHYGDVFKVGPDTTVPTDGTVVSVDGPCEVDESMITGESRPVLKKVKSPLVAGSVCRKGTIYCRTTRLPGENTLDAIAAMVDDAKLSKPRVQAIADRVASYFVPVIVSLAVVVFVVWVAVGLRVEKKAANDAIVNALTYAVTVLIVSCPCAIGLAVPMVVVIASGVAARKGVVFASAHALEIMHKATHVVFDKTGTLTTGRLTIVREWYADNEGKRNINTKSLLLGLVEGIHHPVSASLAHHLSSQGIQAAPVTEKSQLAGKGVQGLSTNTNGHLQFGNVHWLRLAKHPEVVSSLAQGLTTVCFTIDGQVAAIFGLGSDASALRPDAAATVNELQSRGISVHLLSGDDDGAVRSVAASLDILAENVRSRRSPADKQAYIKDLVDAPALKRPVVIFCGDGTNDAAALAQATIGVHMHDGGTAVAQSAADVVLLRPALHGILVGMAVSKKSMHRIAFNFAWSFVYNLFAVLLAAGAFVSVDAHVHVHIPPAYAGLGELVSVLPVVLAATLLRWSKL